MEIFSHAAIWYRVELGATRDIPVLKTGLPVLKTGIWYFPHENLNIVKSCFQYSYWVYRALTTFSTDQKKVDHLN